jgi:hypothetical protein
LGDIDEALKPQLFSLSNIANTINKPNTSTLDKFPLLGKQTVQDLAEIVPNLGDTTTDKIPVIASLIKSKAPQTNLNTSLSNLLSQNPELGKLKLNQTNLSSYTIADIPNLDAVQLSKFAGWQDTLIKDIPGLNAVPLASFPRPLTADGNKVARIDAIWGTAEKRRQPTVSGSDVTGFSVPCSGQKCPYIELDDLENVGRNRRSNLSTPRKDPLGIFIDELPSLYLKALPQWINEYRSNGACFVLGVQSLEQLANAYGENLASAIASACSTKILYNPANYSTAEKFSQSYGHKEFIVKNKSISDSKEGRTVTWTDNLQTMPIITPDEIMRFSQRIR